VFAVEVASGTVRVVSEMVEPLVPWSTSGTSPGAVRRSTERCVDVKTKSLVGGRVFTEPSHMLEERTASTGQEMRH